MSARLLRDDRVSLESLSALAREFDQISRGEHWPAVRFVEWLEREYRWGPSSWRRSGK